MNTQPTDAEISALWKVCDTPTDENGHCTGPLPFARAVLAKWGQPAHASADSVQEGAALSAIDEVLALFPFDAVAQSFAIAGRPELKADGDTRFYSRNKVLTFLTKIKTILDAARAAQKEKP